jgi:hypothetical protein
MDPGEVAKPKLANTVNKTVDKKDSKAAEAPKVVASGSLKENKSSLKEGKNYSLNGG